jgi:hypothetical protein
MQRGATSRAGQSGKATKRRFIFTIHLSHARRSMIATARITTNREPAAAWDLVPVRIIRKGRAIHDDLVGSIQIIVATWNPMPH